MESFRLGSLRVIPALNQVRNGLAVVHVQPKAMRLLLVLAEQPRRVVSREQLAERVWDGRNPTDEVIARTIASLRKSLGDDSKQPSFIETIPKQGYRLIAPVSRSLPAASTSRRAMAAAVILIVIGTGWLTSNWLVDTPTANSRPFELSARVAIGLSGYEEAPDIGPGGNRIAFSYASRDEATHRVMVASLTRTGERPLPLGQPGFDDRYPVWSPGGEDVAFIRSGPDLTCAIVRVGLATGTERLVTPCGAPIITPIDWSPDGETLIFSDQSSDHPGQFVLHRVPAGGGQPAVMMRPEDPGLSDWWPRYSPDGQWIAHIRGTLQEQRIHLTPAAGGATRLWGGGGEGFLYGIAWMADSSGVVYAFKGADDVFSLWYLAMGQSEAIELGARNWALPAVGDRELAAVRLNHDMDVYQIDLLATDESDATSVFDSSGIDGDPALSPDGQRAVLISNRSGARSLWLTAVSSDASAVGQELLRPVSGRLQAPAWSSHGQQVVVLERTADRSTLWLIEVDGHNARAIYQGSERVAGLSFSSDDRSILFGSDRAGSWQIWRLDLESHAVTPVTLHGGYRGQESIDGRWLYFTKLLTDGLFRVPLNEPDDERLILPELAWLDRENWHVTDRGIVIPLDEAEGRLAGLYLLDDEGDLRLISQANLYQSVKPDQAVAVNRQGSVALIVKPAFYQGNVVMVDLEALPIPAQQ